jgi:hypothetical protein
MNPSKTVWLHYGNGVGEIAGFCNPHSDPHQAEGLGVRLNEEIQKAGFVTRLTRDGARLGEFAAFISFDVSPSLLKHLANYPRERCFLQVQEPPSVRKDFYDAIVYQRFGKIFTPFDDFVDSITTIKVHFQFPLYEMQRVSKEDSPHFADKKFCCMIQSNKYFWDAPGELYTERKRIIDFFTKMGNFDLYGLGWQGLSSSKGQAPSGKSATLKNYKFSLCYENTYLRGNITERLFYCLFARCVPVYLGAPDIEQYVPKECFIDVREFSNYHDLYSFLNNMDSVTYERYLEAGQQYLDHDPRFALFRNENIIEKTLEHLHNLCGGYNL